MRKSDYYLTNLGKPSTRTRELEKIKAKLIDELRYEFEEKLIAETVERFVKASTTDDKSDAEENEAEDTVNEEETKKSNKLAVAPWLTNEIRELCRIVKTVKDGGLTEKELASIKEKFNKQKGKKKKTEQEISIGDAGHRALLDITLKHCGSSPRVTPRELKFRPPDLMGFEMRPIHGVTAGLCRGMGFR